MVFVFSNRRAIMNRDEVIAKVRKLAEKADVSSATWNLMIIMTEIVLFP